MDVFWGKFGLEGSVSTVSKVMTNVKVYLEMSLLNMCGSMRCMCMPNMKYVSLLVKKL